MELFLVGDFNWDLLKFESRKIVGDYLDSLYDLGLSPRINKPTRIWGPSSSLLDHIFSSSCLSVVSGVLINEISDHYPLFTVDQIKIVLPKKSQKWGRDMSDVNISSLVTILGNCSFDHVISDPIPSSVFGNFNKIIESATELAFPKVLETERKVKKTKLSPWFSFGLKLSLKTKNRLLAQKKSKPTPVNCEKYMNYKRIYNSTCRAAKKMYLNEQFELNKKNSKNTWRLINDTLGRSRKTGIPVPDCFKGKDKNFTTPVEIADGF